MLYAGVYIFLSQYACPSIGVSRPAMLLPILEPMYRSGMTVDQEQTQMCPSIQTPTQTVTMASMQQPLQPFLHTRIHLEGQAY